MKASLMLATSSYLALSVPLVSHLSMETFGIHWEDLGKRN